MLCSSIVGLGEAVDTLAELPEESSAALPSAQLRQEFTESAMCFNLPFFIVLGLQCKC